MDINILKKIGFNDKEIGLYLALLECGTVSVRTLAVKTGLNRGTTYDILKKLQAKGLVTYHHKKTKQQFAAESPYKLAQLAEEKEAELKIAREKLGELMPELYSLQNKQGEKPVTKFYEGRRGIKSILDDVLSSFENITEKEYFIYSATEASSDINAIYPDYTKNRIKKKIKVKAISLASGGKVSGLDERRWLGTDDASATYIMIYVGRCAFISRDLSGSPVGVIIENKMIYETQKIIFLKLWELLNK